MKLAAVAATLACGCCLAVSVLMAQDASKPRGYAPAATTASSPATTSSPTTTQATTRGAATRPAIDDKAAVKLAIEFVKAKGWDFGNVTQVIDRPDRWVIVFGEKPYPEWKGPPGVWVFKATGKVERYKLD